MWLKTVIPIPVRRFLRSQVARRGIDFFEGISGKRPWWVPPTRLMFDGTVGIEEYIGDREGFLKLFGSVFGVGPDSRILDIGSGIGRTTNKLIGYISKKGSYDGFDIVKVGVEWCNREIASRHKNFRFRWVDIYNGSYNPKGKIRPSKFRFPYRNKSFDVVMATSVFTHMLPEDVTNYLAEVKRVLKPGGKSILSYFLINEKSRKLLKSKGNTMHFKKSRGYWTTDFEMPELAVAYEEEQMLGMYREAGLSVRKIYYGSWCGRKGCLVHQEVIMGRA